MEVHDNVGVQVGNNNVQHIQTADNDVGLVIRYASEKIALDRDNRFYLEVTNRTSTLKRLELAVEGVEDTVATIVPDNVLDLLGREPAKRTLVLQCTENEPMAGVVPLRVVVRDRDTDRVRLQSEPVRILIPEKPQLTSELVPPPEQVSSAGHYTAILRLMNCGNTELRGKPRALDLLDEYSQALGAGQVHIDDRPFDLNPGQQAEIPVTLDFPEQAWVNRTWKVLITVDVEDHEMISGPVTRGCGIIQYGWLTDLRHGIAELAQQFIDWNGRYQRIRRGWLLGCGLLLFIAGLLVGQADAPTGEVSTATPQSTAPGPAAKSPISTSTAPDMPYIKMPCEALKSIVMLEALTTEEARAHGTWLLKSETARLHKLAEKIPALQQYMHSIHASRRDQLCSVTLAKHGAAEKYMTFIWLGPVPTSEAAALCESLSKTNSDDCLPLETT